MFSEKRVSPELARSSEGSKFKFSVVTVDRPDKKAELAPSLISVPVALYARSTPSCVITTPVLSPNALNDVSVTVDFKASFVTEPSTIRYVISLRVSTYEPS